LIILSAVAVGPRLVAAAEPTHPNVLMIAVDDLSPWLPKLNRTAEEAAAILGGNPRANLHARRGRKRD